MNEFEIGMLWREDVDWIDLAQDLNRVEPWLFEIKGADPISDNSEILLDVIRCNKNNIYSDTRLMLIKFTAQESVRYLQIQYNTTNFYKKNPIF
jgi:hypothetical protein